MAKLILASSSPRRLELLQSIGYNPDIISSPDIDETPLKGEASAHLVSRLSSQKVEKVQEEYPNDVIIGGDTIVSLGRRILCKPQDIDEARSFLTMLSGRRHRVYTGISIISPCSGMSTKVCQSIIKFKVITNEEMDFILTSNQWRGVSGAYTIQGAAAALITWMSGSPSTVKGLPLYEANCLLKSRGIKPTLQTIQNAASLS